MKTPETDIQWSVADVAAFLRVSPATVTSYLSRGYIPDPDGRVGRTPWWWASTIRAYQKARPGRGRWGHQGNAEDDQD